MFITGLILYANWSYVKRRKYLLKKDISHADAQGHHVQNR